MHLEPHFTLSILYPGVSKDLNFNLLLPVSRPFPSENDWNHEDSIYKITCMSGLKAYFIAVAHSAAR